MAILVVRRGALALWLTGVFGVVSCIGSAPSPLGEAGNPDNDASPSDAPVADDTSSDVGTTPEVGPPDAPAGDTGSTADASAEAGADAAADSAPEAAPPLGTCADAGDGASCGTCHTCMGGVCSPTSGVPCDDGNACTQTDSCQSGACVGSNEVSCPAPATCKAQGTCDPSTGACSTPNATDDTNCGSGLHCSSGACTCDATSCPNGCCVGGACTAKTTYYQDADGDGYGTPASTLAACAKPTGYVSNAQDCCDSDAVANPGYLASHSAFPWQTATNACGNYFWNCGTTVTLEYPQGTLGSSTCSPVICNSQCSVDCNGYDNIAPSCGVMFTKWSVSCEPVSGGGCSVDSTVTSVPPNPGNTFGALTQGCY
jgi:hypothetical protein